MTRSTRCSSRPRSRRHAVTLGIVMLALLTGGWLCQPPRDLTRQDVIFELTHDLSATDPARAVYVSGDLPELGGGDLAKAVKLVSSDQVHWRVTVSLPVNRAYTYSFWDDLRDFPGFLLDPQPVGGEQTGRTKSLHLLPVAKKLFYHSEFTSPMLHWRQDDGEFRTRRMWWVGRGRHPGEWRWAAFRFGEARRPVEFYIADRSGAGRDPVGDDTYRTPLDAFFLQDESLFTYVPAPSVSPPRRDYEVLPNCLSSTQIESTVLGETREYRVFLPRGYDEHSGRRYPVVYLHNGTTIWDDCLFPPGDITGPMDEDGAIVAELIRLGQTGEVILVGVDNLELDDRAWSEKRARDYFPPGDTVTTLAEELGYDVVIGAGDRHLGFLRDELKPLIDAQYRTVPDASGTFLAGFGIGGTGAIYVAWEAPETFGRVASLSGFYRDAPSLLERIRTGPRNELRIYLDSVLFEAANYEQTVALRDDLVGKPPVPYVVEGDLRHFVSHDPAFGHTYAVAGTRLPQLLSFLYPGSEEPSLLRHRWR